MGVKRGMNRRSFIKKSTVGIISAGILSQAPILHSEEKKKNEPLKIKEYRTLGRTGFSVSDIGSGGTTPVGVINVLLDAGVNYFDTAESYSGGRSEINIGQAIKGRNRKSLFITTKLVLGKKATKENILSRARKCLERLGTDYIDCLMIHSIPNVETLKTEGFHAAVKQLKAEGRLRFCGVSNHGAHYNDVSESMDKVLLAAAEDGRFDVMLFVYNFLQRDMGEKILRACKEKNIGTTLMKTNPVGKYLGMKERVEKLKKDGKKIHDFYNNYIPRLKKEVDKADFFVKKYDLKNPAEIRDAAIRFVLNNKNVNTTNFAFRNFDDVEDVIKLSGTKLSSKDKRTLAAFERGYGRFYCRHACGLCESSCPHDVPVNTIMRYNHYFEAQGKEKYAMLKYAELPTANANRCKTCTGSCESACPYGVPIRGLLFQAHQQLTLA